MLASKFESIPFHLIFYRLETEYIRKVNMMHGVVFIIWAVTGQTLTYSTCITYGVLEGRIDANLAFVALTCFTILRRGITDLMILAIQYLAETLVTLDRLQVSILNDVVVLWS